MGVGRERLHVLDWEYAAKGDPLFELAVIVSCHQFDRQETDLLLEQYDCENFADNRERFPAMLLLYQFIEILWYLVNRLVSPESEQVGFSTAARISRLHRDLSQFLDSRP